MKIKRIRQRKQILVCSSWTESSAPQLLRGQPLFFLERLLHSCSTGLVQGQHSFMPSLRSFGSKKLGASSDGKDLAAQSNVDLHPTEHFEK